MRPFYLAVIFFALSQSIYAQPKPVADSTLRKHRVVSKPRVDGSQLKESNPAEKVISWLLADTDNLTTLIGYVIVALATRRTYKQWRADQEWKKKDALMNRVTSFSVTPGAWNAILMLVAPDRDVPLWDKAKPEERYVRVKRLEVAVALLPHEFLAITYSPKEMAIRDSFDDFLGRLSHLEVYRESGLLNNGEIKSAFSHWVVAIKKLVDSSDLDDQALLRNLSLYIHDRQMHKVISLFEAFGIPIASKREEYRTTVDDEVKQKKWKRLIHKKTGLIDAFFSRNAG